MYIPIYHWDHQWYFILHSVEYFEQWRTRTCGSKALQKCSPVSLSIEIHLRSEWIVSGSKAKCYSRETRSRFLQSSSAVLSSSFYEAMKTDSWSLVPCLVSFQHDAQKPSQIKSRMRRIASCLDAPTVRCGNWNKERCIIWCSTLVWGGGLKNFDQQKIYMKNGLKHWEMQQRKSLKNLWDVK